MNGMFIILGILALSLSYCTYHNNKVNEARIQNDQAVLQQKKVEYEQLKAACQFPDGYVRTGSGYWFNVRKFTNDVMQYRKGYKEALSKDYYDALRLYLDFKIVKGECQLQFLSKSSFWNGKKILEIEDLIKNVTRNNRYIELLISRLIKDTPNLTSVNIFVCYTKECSVSKPKYPATVSDPGDKTCKYFVDFPIKKYPDLKIRFKDCDIKNGQVKKVFRFSNEFIYTGISNFGYPYEFYCPGLLNEFEWKTVPLQEVLNTFDPTGKKLCQGSVTSTYPRDQLYFYGGRYSLSFNTSAMANLGPLIQQSTAYATKYISKEKT